MRVELEVNGVTRDVTVVETGIPGRLRVTWDGRSREVDARQVERSRHGTLWTLIRQPDGRSAQVRCGALAPDGTMGVRIAGAAYDVVVNGRRRRVDGAGAGSAAGGAGRVTAPMPGKVVRVLVAAGDEVEAGQPLVVVEAMKMENELTAERGGTVAEVAVTEGMSVDTGRLLVVIE